MTLRDGRRDAPNRGSGAQAHAGLVTIRDEICRPGMRLGGRVAGSRWAVVPGNHGGAGAGWLRRWPATWAMRNMTRPGGAAAGAAEDHDRG